MDNRNDLSFCCPGCRRWSYRVWRLGHRFFAKAGCLNFQHLMSLCLIAKCPAYKSGNCEYWESSGFAVQSFWCFCLSRVSCCSSAEPAGSILKVGTIESLYSSCFVSFGCLRSFLKTTGNSMICCFFWMPGPALIKSPPRVL